jgi:hypothetical protein
VSFFGAFGINTIMQQARHKYEAIVPSLIIMHVSSKVAPVFTTAAAGSSIDPLVVELRKEDALRLSRRKLSRSKGKCRTCLAQTQGII